jgi:hypothetical protein
VLESATALLQATVWTTAAIYFISDVHQQRSIRVSSRTLYRGH